VNHGEQPGVDRGALLQQRRAEHDLVGREVTLRATCLIAGLLQFGEAKNALQESALYPWCTVFGNVGVLSYFSYD